MLEQRNPELFNALKAFTLEVVEFARISASNGDGVPVMSEFAWKRQEGELDVFQRQLTQRAQHWIWIRRSMALIRTWDTYAQAKKLIEEDSIWSSHVDKLVGSPIGARRIELEDILFRPSAYLLREDNDFDFSNSDFIEVVSAFEHFATSKKIELVRTTPFYGLKLSSNISLTKEVSIESIDDERLEQFLGSGLISDTFSSATGDYVHFPPRTALVTRVMVPKTIKGDDDAPSVFDSSYEDSWAKHAAAESKALELLTLIFGTPLTPIGFALQTTGPVNAGSQYRKFSVSNSTHLQSISLTNEQEVRFLRYWPIVSEESKKSRRFLAIGLR